MHPIRGGSAAVVLSNAVMVYDAPPPMEKI